MRFSALVLTAAMALVALGCGGPHDRTDANPGDTITTTSGLKYVFHRKGEGRNVVPGTEISLYLSMKVRNKQVWNTDAMPDSVYTFVAGKTSLIQGFAELILLLREGDQIAAVLPPHLAYGAQGAGADIPPNAVLVYDRFDVRKVSEPRAAEADTLFAVFTRKGLEAMKATHERIHHTTDSLRYYHDANQWRRLWTLLSDAGMHKEALQIIDYFNTRNERGYRLFRVRSYDNMGLYKQGLDSLEALLRSDTVYRKDNRVINLHLQLKEKYLKSMR